MGNQNKFSRDDTEYKEKEMSGSIEKDTAFLNEKLKIGINFDLLYRDILVGQKQSSMYFIDGFCKDELMQKLLQLFMGITKEDMPEDVTAMLRQYVPYVEVSTEKEWEKIVYNILCGVFALFIDGFDACILIDSRTYPARTVTEPEKD